MLRNVIVYLQSHLSLELIKKLASKIPLDKADLKRFDAISESQFNLCKAIESHSYPVISEHYFAMFDGRSNIAINDLKKNYKQY